MTAPLPHPDDIRAVMDANRPKLLGIAEAVKLQISPAIQTILNQKAKMK